MQNKSLGPSTSFRPVDEWQGGKESREEKERTREKFNQTKVMEILSKRRGKVREI